MNDMLPNRKSGSRNARFSIFFRKSSRTKLLIEHRVQDQKEAGVFKTFPKDFPCPTKKIQ
jgi:hypothetical protein